LPKKVVRFGIMADPPATIRLPDVEPARLRAAVRSVLAQQRAEPPGQAALSSAPTGHLPSAEQLSSDAREALQDEPEDSSAAERFQGLLELGYLVASADGFAPEEREALAMLLEYATAAAASRDVLLLHFNDLDATSAALGRSERLLRAASSFESSSSREQAISFAALVAVADGLLDGAEMQVLLSLGKLFSLSTEQVRALVDQVMASIARALDR